MQQWS